MCIIRLTDEDPKAVFGYLRTLPPIKHRVDNAELPTLCKVCGEMHGAGERNWGNGMAPAMPSAVAVSRQSESRREKGVL